MGLGLCLPRHGVVLGRRWLHSKRCWSADGSVQLVDVAPAQQRTLAEGLCSVWPEEWKAVREQSKSKGLTSLPWSSY